MADDGATSRDSYKRNVHRGVLVSVLVVATLLLGFYVLIVCWPTVVQVAAGKPKQTVQLFGWKWHDPNADLLYMLIVLIFGAMGASVHVMTSAATYLGNGDFRSRWIPWYFVRLPVGMAIALIAYVAMRAGLLTAGTSSASINPYGIAAIAALAGLFSKQATDKLEEVFETLFQTKQGGDAKRQDKLTPPNPG